MYQYTALTTPGYRGGTIANTFVRQDASTQHLGILLPGVAYTTDMPLLYYARAVLLERGADTLSVEANYHRQPEYRSASPAEQYRWLTADIGTACSEALGQRAYERVTLVGKSLGTLAMGYLLANHEALARADCVWLTPLLKQEVLREQIQRTRPHSLLVSGSADGLFDPQYQQEISAATNGLSLVVDGADHSLEVPGDTDASLRALGEVVRAIRKFLT